jgi:hypothetical protein
MSSGLDRRRARGGCGLLHPNPNQWDNEHNGLDLREDLGAEPDGQLSYVDAFALYPNVQVLPHGEVPAAAKYINHFRNGGSNSWSGLAIRISDELELVLYNDSHPPSRVRATLMEEFFHLRLNHPRSVIRVFATSDGARTHDGAVEAEAYGSGAAALLPYAALKKLLAGGTSTATIARAFGVSRELVAYRMKVTKLYSQHRRQPIR